MSRSHFLYIVSTVPAHNPVSMNTEHVFLISLVHCFLCKRALLEYPKHKL